MAKKPIQFNDEQSLDLNQIKKQVESDIKATTLEPVDRFELTPREISFSITYDAPDGKVYSTALTSVILNGDARLAKARIAMQLTRGLNPDGLPAEEKARVEYLSRAAVQLKDPPKWVLDSLSEDNELLLSITQVLMEHEARFFRGNARKGQADEVEKRVSISVPIFDKTAPTE
jgi:hypothetical protein